MVCLAAVAAVCGGGGLSAGFTEGDAVSLFFRSQVEARSVSGAAWIRGEGAYGGSRSSSGESVTADKALRVDALWASVNLLASTVANFPVDVFRGDDKHPMGTPPPLVQAPSLLVSRQDWVYQAMVSLLLRGNAYGMVVGRDSLLRPTAVEWLDPDTVEAEQRSSLVAPTYRVGGSPAPADDLVHLRAFCKPGSAIGMSPVAYHAETLGVSLAAKKYGGQWFRSGGHPTALFQNTQQTVDPEKAVAIKDRISSILRGGKREPLVLGSDWEYKPLQVSAAESEFINTLGYTDAQTARIYGPGLAEVLGYSSGGSSLTYTNRVDRSLDLLTYTVAPWVTKFEAFWTGAIARPQTAKMNVNALLRADPKTRHEMYQIDRNIGLYSVDELRALEDQPPLPDGQGQDYTPLAAKAPASSPTEGN